MSMRQLTISMGIVVLCAVFLLVYPTNVASAHTVIAFHSGGGCNTGTTSGFSVGSCIGASNGASDGYINNGACASKVVIRNVDISSGNSVTVKNVSGSCITGHVSGGTRSSYVSGHQYQTVVEATFSSQVTEKSPTLTW